MLITAISSFWLGLMLLVVRIWNELIISYKVLNYYKISFFKWNIMYCIFYKMSISFHNQCVINFQVQVSLRWNFTLLKEVKTYTLVQINCAGVNSFVAFTWRGDEKLQLQFLCARACIWWPSGAKWWSSTTTLTNICQH